MNFDSKRGIINIGKIGGDVMKSSNTSKRLKEYMLVNNLRQVDLLKLAEPYCTLYNVKLNKSDLSQYVSGKVEPGQDKLFVLAKALRVSEAWLMGYDPSPEKLTPIYFDIGPYKKVEDMTSDELVNSIKQVPKSLENILALLKNFDDALLDSYAGDINILIHYYSTLNYEGKKELLKRAIELNEIERYTKE